MSSFGGKKAKPVDRATPTIRKAKGRDSEKIAITRSLSTAMVGSPQWNAALGVQAASGAWTKVTDDLEANAKVLADLRGKLGAAEALQRGLRRDWNAASRQMTASIGIVCEGSADQVHAFGFDVLSHVAVGELAAPEGLITSPGTASGEAVVAWARGSARHGFVVQHATDVANPATASVPVPTTRSKYTLEGAQASSTVYFRVAAIDPASKTGMAPWSDWVAARAR